jgi:hypothetical protein
MLYFPNATKGFDLTKLKSLPIVYLYVNLSLTIYAVSHQLSSKNPRLQPEIAIFALVILTSYNNNKTRNRLTDRYRVSFFSRRGQEGKYNVYVRVRKKKENL